MKALLLLSHGSRRQESNSEMQRLAAAVSASEAHPFDHVVCAFQQFAQPNYDETIDDLVARGASSIVIFPLFLAAGSHVLVDVPEMIARSRDKYPLLSITVMPHLGKTPGLAAFLLDRAARHA